MKATRFFALVMSVVLLLGTVPYTSVSVGAEYKDFEEEYVPLPIPVSTEGRTYSLFTEDSLDDRHGMSFLYVVKKDGRFYTLADPNATGEFDEYDSVAAIDITAYWDESTDTFANIPDSLDVGVMQYQSYPFPSYDYGGQGLYVDSDTMLNLCVPFYDNGETWFGSIRYFGRDNTYSYSRPIWHALGGGKGYFYDAYYDWYGDDMHVYGVLALKGDRFALRNFSEEYRALDEDEEAQFDVGAYLYAAPCTHVSPEYTAYDAPTCMDKGCYEYWYCVYCNTYFADADCKNAYKCKPVLPALDHDYGDTACNNCGREIPQYTKITSYEQFRTIKSGASFIAVAEIDDGNGGKEYFVLKQPTSLVIADADENGEPDILAVDEDQNGVSDVLEQDRDGDGIADAMMFDGFWDEESLDGVLDDMEIEEYLWALENEYTNGYMVDARVLEAVPVTVGDDGTINVKNMGALEFIMERRFPDDMLDEQYYGDGATVLDYENDFYFRVPNFWVRPMVTMDNNWYQQGYEYGDAKWWGVLFGDQAKEISYYYESYAETFGTEFPDDAVVLYTESFGSINSYGEPEHGLRFLVDGDEKHFIITSYSYWEEIQGEQIPIYLYASETGDAVHEHVWSEWSSYTEETHGRVCTVEGCTALDFACHIPGEECTPDTENYELGHWVTCTVCNVQIHEYHTPEEAGRYYPNYWRDTGDGIHHVVYCTKCQGPVEYAEHRWYDWYAGAKEIDGEWVMGHYRSCKDWPCEASNWQLACIYDEGTVTKEPTCTENGSITYVCTGESCQLETRTYTEEIPALGHAWDEGTVIAEPTYDSDGSIAYQCLTCGDCKVESIPKLPTADEIVCPEHGDIKVTVPDGSGAVLDADTVLHAEEAGDSLPDGTLASIEEIGGDGAEVLAAFDISLLLNGMPVQPGGVIEVTLPIPASASEFEELAVAYVDEEGNAALCETQDNGDGTLTFATDHFSLYAVIGIEPKASHGDVNGDQKINGKDVTKLLQYLANLDPFSGVSTVEISAGADCNADGKIDGKDLTKLLRYLANIDPATGESDIVLG